jgi:hypothetical protein
LNPFVKEFFRVFFTVSPARNKPVTELIMLFYKDFIGILPRLREELLAGISLIAINILND